MACKYEILEGAQRDFDAILGYLLAISDGPSAARGFVAEYEKQVSLICENPELYGFSRMPELAELGYRAVPVNNYVALYSFRNDTVFVAHIFHQRQDYTRLV